jgi:hypothetical protein
MVFQNYVRYPHIDVTDNITLGLRLHHTPKTDFGRRLDAVVTWLRLDGLLERMSRQLSEASSNETSRPWPLGCAGAAGLPDGRAPVEPRRAAGCPQSDRTCQPSPPSRRNDQDVIHDHSEAMTMARRVAIMGNVADLPPVFGPSIMRVRPIPAA